MNTNTILKIGGIALLTVAVAFVAVGTGAAQSSQTELANETVDVTNDTQALHVSAASSNGTLDISVSGIDNGTESQVTTGTLNASTDAATFEHVVDGSYSSYRVVVTGTDATDLEVAKLEITGGGGGGIIGGVGGNIDPQELPPSAKAIIGIAVAAVVAGLIARIN